MQHDDDLLNRVSNFLSDNVLDHERTKELHIIDGQEQKKGNRLTFNR